MNLEHVHSNQATLVEPALPFGGAALDPTGVAVDSARAEDAAVVSRLINDHVSEGRLLPRAFEEIAVHVGRFVVVRSGGEMLGCAELAPLSQDLAEIRSMVVRADWRGLGLGRQLVDEIKRRARQQGFQRLCALTHDPVPFVRWGFSLVPHVWLREKIGTDCHRCAHFRHCSQHAVLFTLAGRSNGAGR